MKRNNIVKTIIRWKVYYDRGRSYVSMIQSILMVSIFIKLFELSSYSYLILIPGFIIGMLVIGYLDKKYKLRELEIKEINTQNLIIKQIATDVQEIIRKIK